MPNANVDFPIPACQPSTEPNRDLGYEVEIVSHNITEQILSVMPNANVDFPIPVFQPSTEPRFRG